MISAFGPSYGAVENPAGARPSKCIIIISEMKAKSGKKPEEDVGEPHNPSHVYMKRWS
jgi:hypothetical protein